jgi:hypothetical protein
MDKFVRTQRRVMELVRLLGADHGQLSRINKADLRGERGLVPVDVLVRESVPRHGQSLQKSLKRSGAMSVYLTVC